MIAENNGNNKKTDWLKELGELLKNTEVEFEINGEFHDLPTHSSTLNTRIPNKNDCLSLVFLEGEIDKTNNSEYYIDELSKNSFKIVQQPEDKEEKISLICSAVEDAKLSKLLKEKGIKSFSMQKYLPSYIIDEDNEDESCAAIRNAYMLNNVFQDLKQQIEKNPKNKMLYIYWQATCKYFL